MNQSAMTLIGLVYLVATSSYVGWLAFSQRVAANRSARSASPGRYLVLASAPTRNIVRRHISVQRAKHRRL